MGVIAGLSRIDWQVLLNSFTSSVGRYATGGGHIVYDHPRPKERRLTPSAYRGAAHRAARSAGIANPVRQNPRG